MATKKETSTVRYTVLRDFGGNLAGDTLDLEPANAADLIRDGMIAPAEEG